MVRQRVEHPRPGQRALRLQHCSTPLRSHGEYTAIPRSTLQGRPDWLVAGEQPDGALIPLAILRAILIAKAVAGF